MMATKLRNKFWQSIPLDKMTKAEWEALCDGCGKCCLIKLEDKDTDKVYYTNLSCHLLNPTSCQCRSYGNRHSLVPMCLSMSYETLKKIVTWLPKSCTYKLLYEGDVIPHWHHLISNDKDSVHSSGNSVREKIIPQDEVPEEFWEEYVIGDDI